MWTLLLEDMLYRINKHHNKSLEEQFISVANIDNLNIII